MDKPWSVGASNTLTTLLPKSSASAPSTTASTPGGVEDAAPFQSCDLVPRNNGSRYASQAEGKQRIRIGHRKSRQGCYNCKKRKIKCQETHPSCWNCMKHKLECKYPAQKPLSALKELAPQSPIFTVTLQDTPTMFSMVDMKFFHHFLTIAYPYLPMGKDLAWTTQVPLAAHNNEFLMHAILGMAASHLQLITGADFGSEAMHHRYLAIRGSNEAMSNLDRRHNNGDALLAACYLLAFQSSYMIDGMQEFFQTVRGCSQLNTHLVEDLLPLDCEKYFRTTKTEHWSLVQQTLVDLPIIDMVLIEGAQQSLSTLFPIISAPADLDFYARVVDCVDTLKVTSHLAYYKFLRIFQGINDMENAKFTAFINPDNTKSRLLLINFLAVQLIMAPIIDREYTGVRPIPIRNQTLWISSAYENAPPEMKNFLAWPKAISDCVLEELAGRQSLIPHISILRRSEGLSKRYV
ncbi:hypothetical protein B0J14DRAFT_53362 [Halenospora varia]|nr:hypothetical protein B0J14DRAFT_53362 [Halenospora varia]